MALLAGTRGQTRKGAGSKAPLTVSSRTGVGRDMTALVSTCLSENPGPGERCRLKPFGVSPVTTARPPRWVSGRVSFWDRRIQTVHHGKAGKAPVPEQANDARGREDADGSTSLLSCWQTRVMAASTPKSNLTKQGPSTVSQ